MDVTTAFLNGILDEEIYMVQPPGFIKRGQENKVCHLHKSLYGLKQAPLCWNQQINHVLHDGGFTRAVSEYGVYCFTAPSGSSILIALYVDDLLIMSSDLDAIKSVKTLLSSHFKMKDLGLAKTFLGLDIAQTSGRVSLSLKSYIDRILSSTNMLDCNSVSTPLPAGYDFFLPSPALSDITSYRSLVGKLLFGANTVRPDISFAVSALSRFLQAPNEIQYKAAKHVVRYLKGTRSLGLNYFAQNYFSLTAFCDADWASDKNDRRSTTGYIFQLAGAPITWKSKKQQTVALSTAEAEYMALGDAVKEILWLLQLSDQLKIKFDSVPIIFC